MNPEEIKLTQYSHGAGCGCKISPAVLDIILHSPITHSADPNLLVGNTPEMMQQYLILEMEMHSSPQLIFLCRLWMMPMTLAE